MKLSSLEFIKCSKCKKDSLFKESYFKLFDGKGKLNGQILEWECPFCSSIIYGEELKNSILQELEEGFETKKDDFRIGQFLKYEEGEISPRNAKELAEKYIKNLKTEYKVSFKNIRVYDSKEEWWVYFDKISPKKGIKLIPPDYRIIINKKTGETGLV
ncbi:hypothetical protein ACFLYY_02025 [Patescibacteria group bacterium]